MNVEISKNLLAGALSALGKLVCRTSPLEAYRSLQIESDALALPVDLVTEVVCAAFLRLVNSALVQFDAVQFGIHSALSHVCSPMSILD